MIQDRPRLNTPPGSIYFSQMHALRWRKLPPKDVLDRLYNEILLHSLQANAIVITDSHAIQNAWLRDLLSGTEKYNGIKDLFSEGVILIAKRKAGNANEGVPLPETAEKQINKAPVIIDEKEVLMPPGFATHAAELEVLIGRSKIPSPIYDMKVLDLEARMRTAFSKPEIYKNYGLDRDVTERLDDMTETYFLENGNFMAAKLYMLPDQSPEIFGKYGDQIKGLATSVHACNFAMSYSLAPATSTAAFDHEGAMSLYRTQMSEVELLEPDGLDEQERAFVQEIINPLKLGITPTMVLKIREQDEFKNYVLSQQAVMDEFRNTSTTPSSAQLKRLHDSSQQFAQATFAYLQTIMRIADISIPPAGTEMHRHYSRIKNAAADSYWVWQKTGILGGFINAFAQSDTKREEEILHKSRETSQRILYSINRIINLL